MIMMKNKIFKSIMSEIYSARLKRLSRLTSCIQFNSQSIYYKSWTFIWRWQSSCFDFLERSMIDFTKQDNCSLFNSWLPSNNYRLNACNRRNNKKSIFIITIFFDLIIKRHNILFHSLRFRLRLECSWYRNMNNHNTIFSRATRYR